MAGQAQAVRDELAWSRCVAPIAEFLSRPAFAPDALAAARIASAERQALAYIQRQEQSLRLQASQMQRLEEHIQRVEQERDRLRKLSVELGAHLQAIQNGRVMRLMNVVSSFLRRE